MGIKFYDSNGKYWGEYDETISLFIPSEETITQAETQNSNLTFEKADERCKGCNHYKLTCDLFSEICHYEPKDEPQTDYTGSPIGDYRDGAGAWRMEGSE